MKRFFSFNIVLAGSLVMLAATACAAQYDLKKITPEIDAALKNRQARFAALQRLKQAGAVGENNQGFLTSLQGDHNALVGPENRDREIIYQALVSQNQLGPQGIREVQRAFSEVQREKARGGENVQLPSGEWVKKS